MNADKEEFTQLVREALAHLYDHAYLQLHPLSQRLVNTPQQKLDGTTLHRILVETIEILRPSDQIPADDSAWRPYLALNLRYVEGMDVGQIADELSISPRQLRREHHKGLEALTEILWDKYLQRQRVRAHSDTDYLDTDYPDTDYPDTDASRATPLDTEIERLTAAIAPEAATEVAATIQGVLVTLADLSTRRHIDFLTNLPDDLPSISVPRVTFRQIILNVLTHLLEVEIEKTIRLDASFEDEQVEVCIRYSSSGGGLEQHEETRLAVAKRLIRSQGGRMEVGDGEEKVVQLCLPVHQAPTVLLVDDNREVVRLFRRYLAGGAYSAIGATTCREALRLASEAHPDAIILDVMMPDQDGWELLQHFKNHPATEAVPVIVCSVLRERDLAISLGAEAFLAKPVTQQSLLSTLARACHLRSNTAGLEPV